MPLPTSGAPNPATNHPSDPLAPTAPAPKTRRWHIWLGFAISAVFLFVAFRGLSPRAVLDTLRQVDWRWLPLALLCYAAGVGVRAVRWSILLRPVASLSPLQVLPVTLAGYAANNILPLRTGEVVRAWLLGSRHGVSKSATLATIALERLLDGLTMLLFLVLGMTAISATPALQRLAWVAGALFAAIIAGMLVVLLAGRRRDRLIRWLLRPLPERFADRIATLAESFLGGLGALTRGGDLLAAVLASVLAWGLEGAMYWAIGQGFGDPLAAALTPAAALLTTGVANLATLVPSGPGYVGAFEAGVLLVVEGALRQPHALALSFALLVHAALWVPVTLAGGWCWWRAAAGQRERDAADPPVRHDGVPVSATANRMAPTRGQQ